jgi:hypothetical protein
MLTGRVVIYSYFTGAVIYTVTFIVLVAECCDERWDGGIFIAMLVTVRATMTTLKKTDRLILSDREAVRSAHAQCQC